MAGSETVSSLDNDRQGGHWARSASRLTAVCGSVLLLAAGSVQAGDPRAGVTLASGADLSDLSLDQLMNIEVTSVSKHAEPLFNAAAAIFVVTGEEIRSSGVRTIADALRLAPGIQVVRSNAQSYTITARGLGGDKLEVVMDGRSVYTPLTSTVFWDVLDTYLPDIERIEVIRGPGATLWGANAVNAVINIVTRSAKDTRGTEVQGGGGNEERAFGAIRSGTTVGESGYARVFVQARELDSSEQQDGTDALDGMRFEQAGFRYDGTTGVRQSLTISGGVYDAREHSAGIPATNRTITDASGGNLGAQWSYSSASAGELSLAGHYDRYKRQIPAILDETRDTLDLSFQHRIALGARNNLTWGLGARQSKDETGGVPLAIIFEPQDRRIRTYSAFVQDQIRLGVNGQLTLGSKFENNDFTGNEVQPSVRLGWTLREHLFAWGSVARAVRTPNRLDHDVAIFCSTGIAALTGCTDGSNLKIGSPDFDSEKLTAYEWGLRWSNDSNVSVFLATFFNDYTDLRSSETTPPPFGSFDNGLEAQGKGAELSLNWIVNDWLELRPFYAYLDLNVDSLPISTDFRTARTLEGSSARNKAGFRVSVKPSPNISADAFLRYVGKLKALAVPGYTELNLRLAWRLRPSLELALVGENLLDARHPETGSAASATQPQARSGNEIERSIFAEFRWTWH